MFMKTRWEVIKGVKFLPVYPILKSIPIPDTRYDLSLSTHWLGVIPFWFIQWDQWVKS